jgi:nicotinate-nucleotide--dimethylbenzimidazole phosphoribosyltransferase
VSESGESAALIDRIESFTPNNEFTLPGLATGSLEQLITWWLERGSGLRSHQIQVVSGGFEVGVSSVDSAVDAGATLLTFHGDIAVEPVITRAIIGLLTRKDAWQVSHQGPGASDQTVMKQLAATVDLMRTNRDKRAEPGELAHLDSTGTIDFLVGALLAASARKTPVILGSTQELAAALIAHRRAMKASSWWRNGATSPDRAVGQAVDRMGIAAGLPLDLSDDLGVGAQISVDLLNSFV